MSRKAPIALAAIAAVACVAYIYTPDAPQVVQEKLTWLENAASQVAGGVGEGVQNLAESLGALSGGRSGDSGDGATYDGLAGGDSGESASNAASTGAGTGSDASQAADGGASTQSEGSGGSTVSSFLTADGSDASADSTSADSTAATSSDASSESDSSTGSAYDPAADASVQAQRALQLMQDAAGSFAGKVDGLQGEGISVAQLLEGYELLQGVASCDYVNGISYTYINNSDDIDGCTVTGFELTYLVDADDEAAYAGELDAAVTDIVNRVQASGAGGDEAVALAAADAIQATCMGASGSTSTLFCAYGCLVEHSAVGKGFADAYKLVLDKLGIPCLVLHDTGAAKGSGTYWNLVQVDGAWYHVNLYWDSRTKAGETATHLYFLCDDDAMRAGGATSWDAPEQVSQGYYAHAVGTTDEEHLAFAADIWKQLLDSGEASLGGLEKYRLTYDEFMRAFDTLSQGWYGYVASRGAVYLSSTGDTDAQSIVTTITAEYRLTSDQLSNYAQVMQEGVQKLTDWVDRSASTYDQVLAVHDWIVRNCSYDESDQTASHTAWGVVANQTAVCEGYSQAFKLAMDDLGIPCVIVRSEDMTHQWNMVCIDGTWYHVDVTWDDPTPDRGWDGDVSHEHFLRSDASMQALGYYGWQSDYTAPQDWA